MFGFKAKTRPARVAERPTALAAPVPFPGDRELIAVVHCTFGPINVYMPTMQDMEGLDASHPNFYKAVAAKAINKSYAEFQQMSFVDGSAIVHKVADALDRLYPFTTV